jgi:hypothetical protein
MSRKLFGARLQPVPPRQSALRSKTRKTRFNAGPPSLEVDRCPRSGVSYQPRSLRLRRGSFRGEPPVILCEGQAYS